MNSETPEISFNPPVNQLLSLGRPDNNEQRNYAMLGISSENISELIRMATDEQLNDYPHEHSVLWAPVHAWRALGQLCATEAIEPLLSLFQRIDKTQDDWVQSDLPKALAQMGAAAIEPVTNYLADPNHGEWARSAASETIGYIGKFHPDLRAECVAKLAAQLEKFSEQSETLNAFLICPLWDLRAVEAMPVIERAYAAGCVDESVTGDVEDVQIHFGLKKKREHSPKPNRLTELRDSMLGFKQGLELLGRENPDFDPIEDHPDFGARPKPYIAPPKTGRNEPCPCGSGKKYKKCCGA